MTDRELGLAGLVAAGIPPADAWAEIRRACDNPETRAILDHLASTPEGRAALDGSRRAWARHGLPAPFDDPPDRE